MPFRPLARRKLLRRVRGAERGLPGEVLRSILRVGILLLCSPGWQGTCTSLTVMENRCTNKAMNNGEADRLRPDRHHGKGTELPTLLCVANFPSSTGFAWTFIEEIYASVARRLYEERIRTLVAYPVLNETKSALQDSAARPVERDVNFQSPGALWGLVQMIRRHNIQVMYLSDRPAWNPAYALLRAAGVRWIVTHDHSSGERTRPTGIKRSLKGLSRRLPGMLADRVVGVSEFVKRRKLEVNLVPSDRVSRIWNAVRIPDTPANDTAILREKLGIAADRPVVALACRATPEKGGQHLLRAFEKLCQGVDWRRGKPLLVYMGSGPALRDWQEIRDRLTCAEHVLFAGYRTDADEILGAADVAVVPSIWAEAFGLSALEPMSRGTPVVASEVGGLPEVIEHEKTGLLVPPGDEDALAHALGRLLKNPEERRRMGEKGRARTLENFAWDDMITEITELLREGFHR